MTKNNQIIHQLASYIRDQRLALIADPSKIVPWDNLGEAIPTILATTTRKEFQLVLSFLDEAKQHVAIVPVFSKYRNASGKMRYRYRYEIKLNYVALASKRTREGCKGYILRKVFAVKFPELFSKALNAVNESEKTNKAAV
jgi:hypothetical protein